MGYFINSIRTHLGDDALAYELKRVREERNFIVHHSLRTYPVLSEEECVKLMLRIEVTLNDIVSVQDKLIAVLREKGIIDIGQVLVDLETGEIEDL